MPKPKVIIQLYPMLPTENREEREQKRPLARDKDLYHHVLHEWMDIVKAADEMGVWGISTIEHHLHSEGYEVGAQPGRSQRLVGESCQECAGGRARVRHGDPGSDSRGRGDGHPRSHHQGEVLLRLGAGISVQMVERPGAVQRHPGHRLRRARRGRRT